MKININKQYNVKTFLYPDSQPHVKIEYIDYGEVVNVTCSITSSETLMYLLLVSNAISNQFGKKKNLIIPYLMGARFDRLMEEGDSVDLKVVADLINYCNFERVVLFDVHSDVASMAINNSDNFNNQYLVESYRHVDSILICPDAGAVKKIPNYLKWNPNLTDVVYCNKVRDLKNHGRLTITVMEPEKCHNKNCVIIDDLCDGGGTFLGIASQIQPKHLSLIVSHGIFSKGIDVFEGKFDEIITSDSYPHNQTHEILKTIKFN
jgi:ribose-phosphate pyrophosphokinase